MARNINTKTTAQQAAIDELRAAKRTTAQQAAINAKVDAAAQAQPPRSYDEAVAQREAAEAEVLNVEVLDAADQSSIDQMLAAMGVSSIKRYLLGAVASLASAAGVAYLGSTLLAGAFVAIAASGWVFLAWVAAIIGALLLLRLTFRVAKRVFTYVAAEEVDAHIAVIGSMAKSAFSFVFGSGKPAVAKA